MDRKDKVKSSTVVSNIEPRRDAWWFSVIHIYASPPKDVQGLVMIDDLTKKVAEMIVHLRHGVEFFHEYQSVWNSVHDPAHHFLKLPIRTGNPSHGLTELIDGAL